MNNRYFLNDGVSLVLGLGAVLFVVYVISEPNALSVFSLTALANNTAPFAIAAAGATLIVLTRGFDLSSAGVISVANVLVAVYPMEGPGGALASLVVVLGAGALVGAVNGWLVAYAGLQSVAATLGTMIVTQGIALLVLPAPGGTVAEWLSYELTDQVASIPITALIVLAVCTVWLLLKRTNLGVGIYAIGQDETAAHLAGIAIARVRFLAFVLAGLAYALAGYMLAAQTATGNPTSGNSLLLLTFAAVAIGGTSFSGGRGGVIASVIAALTLVLLQKVLFATGVQSFYIGLFQGAVMLLAVSIAALAASLGARRMKSAGAVP